MEQADWSVRWAAGRTAFHQPSTNRLLSEHAARVWGPRGPRRVYVPLCGKSLDLVFLAERLSRGHGPRMFSTLLRPAPS